MQEFIGFDQDAFSYIKNYKILDETPGIIVENDAFVSPFGPTIEGNFLEELSGGAFDSHGNLIPGSTQPRSDGRNAVCVAQPPAQPLARTRIPRAVFGGFAFDHFGHFLLETTARLWCLPELRDTPWLFLTDGRPSLAEYQKGFLELLGLAPEQIIAVSDWCQVDELVVPSPSFVYHHSVTHAYRDTFRRARLHASQRAPRRIFLSRGNMTIARTIGERELEAVLVKDGWEIVIPERLSPAEQAQLFQDENILMGLQGSAMHLGLFAPPGRRSIHLCRGTGYRGYYILDDLMQADVAYLAAMSDHPLTAKPIRGPFLLDLDRTIAFLRDKDLLSPRAASAALPSPASRAGMDDDYRAWWHYTESQVRYHQQLADDGTRVSQYDALESALHALALRPSEPEILSHAIALKLKFEGVDAAGVLLDGHQDSLANTNAPTDAHLLYLQSTIEDGRGNYEPALAAGQRALRLAPGNTLYLNQVATVLFRLRRLDDAEMLLRTLVDTNAAAGVNYFLLSVVQLDRGEIEDGIALARKAVHMDGNDIGLCRHLSSTLDRHGRPHEALEACHAFLARHPGTDAALLMETARLEQLLGHVDAALEHRLAAYRMAPLDDAQTQTSYRDELTHIGLFPDLSVMGTAITPAVREQGVLLYRRSIALTEQGSLEQALRVAVIAVQLDPENRTIMQNLLGLMIRTKRPRDAHVLVRALIDRGMASGETFYVLSLVEGDLGRLAPAVEAARRAVELEPANDLIADHYRRLSAAG